jgi:16S rRNA (guanine527-N7)-methyltransferase
MSVFAPERDGVWIERAAAALGRVLPSAAREPLGQYVAFVDAWNRKLNLTGARTPQALAEVLLADALVLSAEEFVPNGARVLDVGSGAGAPIVPLLLLRADVQALCLEPLGKRATFLRTVSGRLGLHTRMRVQEARLDLARPEIAEPGSPAAVFAADLACSRATFAPELWLPAALQLAPRALVLTASAEPPVAPRPAQLTAQRAYALPFSSAPRHAAAYARGAAG